MQDEASLRELVAKHGGVFDVDSIQKDDNEQDNSKKGSKEGEGKTPSNNGVSTSSQHDKKPSSSKSSRSKTSNRSFPSSSSDDEQKTFANEVKVLSKFKNGEFGVDPMIEKRRLLLAVLDT